MTQMLLAVSVVAWTTGIAYEETDTPVIDQRQANQE